MFNQCETCYNFFVLCSIATNLVMTDMVKVLPLFSRAAENHESRIAIDSDGDESTTINTVGSFGCYLG